MLTNEQKQAHVDSGGSTCPHCQSDHIVGDSLEVDDGVVTQMVACNTCGERWTDVFRLSGIVEDSIDPAVIQPDEIRRDGIMFDDSFWK